MTGSESMKDAETILENLRDMRSHLAALHKVDPSIAHEIEDTWNSTVKALHNIQARSMAARLILGGQYDKTAHSLVSDAGISAVLKMTAGKAPMPDSIRKTMEADPVLKLLL